MEQYRRPVPDSAGKRRSAIDKLCFMIGMHRLEGFYWVARSSGYANAVREMPYPVTQPALHQQVRKLEKELGTTLLERVGKGTMKCTPAGDRLYQFVAPYFRELDQVVAEIRAGDYGGTLSLLAEPMLIRQLLPPWLTRLQREHPEIRIDLGELAEPSVDALQTGGADAVLAYLPSVPDDIASIEVAQLHPFLVVPRRHVTKGRRVKVRELRERFISYRPGSLAHDLQMRALSTHEVNPTQVIAVDSTETILGFVASGLGFSLVPSLERDGPKGRTLLSIPVRAPGMRFAVSLAWRKDTPENPLLDALIESAPR